jgi:hypothetical protein
MPLPHNCQFVIPASSQDSHILILIILIILIVSLVVPHFSINLKISNNIFCVPDPNRTNAQRPFGNKARAS